MAELSAAPQLLLETDGDAQLINPDRSYQLGRDPDSDVVLADPRVSWHHAVLHTAPDGHWMLDDEGSTNGTFVDGYRVRHLDLCPGTLLRFGDAVDGAWAQIAALPEPTKVNRRPSALTALTGSYRQPTPDCAAAAAGAADRARRRQRSGS